MPFNIPKDDEEEDEDDDDDGEDGGEAVKTYQAEIKEKEKQHPGKQFMLLKMWSPPDSDGIAQ